LESYEAADGVCPGVFLDRFEGDDGYENVLVRAGSGADTIKKGWADNKWPVPEIKEHFGQNDDRVELTLRLVQSTSSPKKETESGLKSRLKSGLKSGLFFLLFTVEEAELL